MTSSFADLHLSSEVVRTLDAMRITEPTPIQAAVIPDSLKGRDVLGRAPTGSGKTLGFGLPLLQLVEKSEPRRPRGLVLAPTRELAEQIKRDLLPVAVALDRSLVSIYGGVGMGKQIAALRKGVDVVIATPGRLLDLMDQGEVALDRVDRVVVDEADRMADMGFLPDVRQILDLTNAKRQTVLFSATLDEAVEIVTRDYQTDPVTHSFGGEEPDITQMSHRFLRVRQADRVGHAADVIEAHGSTMVFCRTRHGVDRVCRQLKQMGIRAGWIHGGRSQNQRDAALLAFVDGRVRALIATDVAARGIHVDEVACVLHFDPPADAKDYIHRSGRTARAGSAGAVVSFVTPDQTKKVRNLQRQVGLEVEIEAADPPSDRTGARSVTDNQLGLNPNRQSQKRSSTQARGRRGSGKGPDVNVPRVGGKSKKAPAKTADRASDSPSARPTRGPSSGTPSEGKRSGTRQADGKRSGDKRSEGKRSEGKRSEGKRSEGKRSEGKAKAKKSKRSGKPRPKNKSASRKSRG